MRLLNIEKRSVTVELSPEDCRRLANACEQAAGCANGPSISWDYFETFAAAFEAAAMAAGVDSVLLTEKRYSLDTLEELEIVEPIWNRPAAS